MKLLTLLPLFLLLGLASARGRFLTPEDEARLEKRQTSDTAIYPEHNFDQLVDHFPDDPRYAPHTNKTFKQRYYFDSSYYKPGGPILLYIGGETSGPSRFEFMQTGIIKILMEATNGLGIILENRYYGKSYPYNLSTTDNLRFLSTEQTIADNAYFAQHAKFPGVEGNSNGTLNAPNSAWILYGGSLAGAQTAFSVKTYGGDAGILWGGIAASGVTHAVLGYPQWYAPIQKYGPQDCIGSINGIVRNMDAIFDSGDAAMIYKMKSVFGMEGLSDGDFAQAVAFPIGGPLDYPTSTWQELNWNPALIPYGSYDFWYFCWNVTNLNAPESITKVDYALSNTTNGKPWPGLGNYANYIKKYVNPICTGGFPLNHTPFDGHYCFGTQNQTYWADIRNSAKRSYLWTTCTEGGFYQVAQKYGPSLVANPLNIEYTQQWCTWAFPPGNTTRIPPTPDLARWNKYGGLSVIQDRLAHVDGDQDVWGDVCFHSTDAPLRFSPTKPEEERHPELLIAGGGHHWDSYGLGGVKYLGEEPQFIQNAQLWEIRTVQRWMEEWHNRK